MRLAVGPVLRQLFLALIVLGGVLHGLGFAYATSDDAFISVRYAQNLVDGHGLLYNPGAPPVEGFSNLLFTLSVALLLKLGLPPLLAVKGIGLLSFAASLLLLPRVVAALRGLRRDGDGLEAAALLAASSFAALWAVAGLEAMFQACLLLGAVGVAIGETRLARVAWTPLLFVLVVAGRSEGALLAAAVAATQWALCGFTPPVFRAWTIRFALPVALLVGARWLYYGAILPNTYAAKVVFGADALGNGARYLGGFALEGGHAILVLAVVAAGLLLRGRPRPPVVLLLLAAVVAQFVFALLVGGDFMPAYRFLMPVYPLLCALAGAALVEAGRWRLPLVLLACLLLLGSQNRALAGHPLRFWLIHSAPWWSYVGQTGFDGTFLAGHQTVGRYLREHSRPDDLLATTEAGVMPHLAGLETLDLLGLNEPRMAALWKEGRSDSSWERVIPEMLDHVFAREPRWIVVDGHLDPASQRFTPRLPIAFWLSRHADWPRYRIVLTAEVYRGEPLGLAWDRINLVFERQQP